MLETTNQSIALYITVDPFAAPSLHLLRRLGTLRRARRLRGLRGRRGLRLRRLGLDVLLGCAACGTSVATASPWGKKWRFQWENHRKTIGKWRFQWENHGKTVGKWRFQWENHRKMEVLMGKLSTGPFPIAMLNYQRVKLLFLPPKMNGTVNVLLSY